MPENINPKGRSAKKRKPKEHTFPRDGRDSSFVSWSRDSSEDLQLKQSHGNRQCNETDAQKLKLQEAAIDPQRHQLSLRSPTEKSLKDHMESILSEVKEAREKLFQWWRQEIQTIVDAAGQRRASDTDAGKRKEQGDCGASRDVASLQATSNGGHTGEKNSEDPIKLGTRKPHNTSDACKGDTHDSITDSKKSGELLSLDCKPVGVNVAIESGSETTSKTVNELDQGNFNDKTGPRVDISVHNTMTKLPPESKSPLFDMSELGGDSKDVEGLDGTLESGVTMREGLEFNKANHDIQKGLDGLERLRETRSALLDMGFDDEESNEGNGIGCSLESAASSKVNPGFSKASVGVSSSFNKVLEAGFAASSGEQGRDYLGSNGGPEGAASSVDAYGSIKVKKEVLFEEWKHAAVKDRLVNNMRGGRLDDDSSQVDRWMGARPGHTSLKRSHIGGNSLAQVSQPKDVQQQVGMGARSGCGIKRSYATAMTFKGSALECKNDVFQQSNTSFADVFNSDTSTILVVKDSVQLPAVGDKGKVDSLNLPSETDTLCATGGASSSWNMFTTPKNAIEQTLQDSKAASVEYASRSKLGDAISGSGRTVDFPGFESMLNFSSHFKGGTEMMDAYQQHERANPSSMYFSSLCTNNSVYLPTSNRVMSVQHSTPSPAPSSASGSWPMLMGMPGHLGGHQDRGHHDPSNMHTFLGLGMNGVPAVPNGMQVFSGLYLQNNQPHNQAPYKTTSQSTAPMVSHQENSAAQEKAILELNF